MSRTASEGLVLAKEESGKVSIIEINSETDFVAKNRFYKFCKELSDLNFISKGNLEKLNDSKMKNGSSVKDNLVNLIAKIGEKITIKDQIILITPKDKIFSTCILRLKKILVK